MRRREGTLLQRDATDPREPGHFGDISGVDDFLDKAERLIAQYDTLPNAMRAEFFRALKRNVVRLRTYLANDIEPRDHKGALFHMMSAAFNYRSLLAELADDERPDPRKRITRKAYFAALAEHKTQEATAAALGVSVTALTKWRKKNAVAWDD